MKKQIIKTLMIACYSVGVLVTLYLYMLEYPTASPLTNMWNPYWITQILWAAVGITLASMGFFVILTIVVVGIGIIVTIVIDK